MIKSWGTIAGSNLFDQIRAIRAVMWVQIPCGRSSTAIGRMNSALQIA